jgi:hypothetical protein
MGEAEHGPLAVVERLGLLTRGTEVLKRMSNRVRTIAPEALLLLVAHPVKRFHCDSISGFAAPSNMASASVPHRRFGRHSMWRFTMFCGYRPQRVSFCGAASRLFERRRRGLAGWRRLALTRKMKNENPEDLTLSV